MTEFVTTAGCARLLWDAWLAGSRGVRHDERLAAMLRHGTKRVTAEWARVAVEILRGDPPTRVRAAADQVLAAWAAPEEIRRAA